MGAPKIKFTVITATYNAAAVLPRLISSLQAQTDQDFEWVVADGASTDETLALLEEAGKTLNVRVDSRPDFGIYDALNRAVRMAEGDYYLVVGADDELFPDAVEKYKKHCMDTGGGLITANIEIGGKVQQVRKPTQEWVHGAFAHVSSHSVGLAIKRVLHGKYGYYSNKFPIAADQAFILKVVHGKESVLRADFVAGKYCLDGTSGAEALGCLLESYRIQCVIRGDFFIQTIALFLRILKNFSKYSRSR